MVKASVKNRVRRSKVTKPIVAAGGGRKGHDCMRSKGKVRKRGNQSFKKRKKKQKSEWVRTRFKRATGGRKKKAIVEGEKFGEGGRKNEKITSLSRSGNEKRELEPA